jgi:hypothetical protein
MPFIHHSKDRRHMKRSLLITALAMVCQAASAQTCTTGSAVRIVGDIPAAISYDVYEQLQPITPERLALFTQSRQVVMLPDGTRACRVKDDGVAGSQAALVHVPGNTMSLWVPQARLQAQ